jgi:hypothetical protein
LIKLGEAWRSPEEYCNELKISSLRNGMPSDMKAIKTLGDEELADDSYVTIRKAA